MLRELKLSGTLLDQKVPRIDNGAKRPIAEDESNMRRLNGVTSPLGLTGEGTSAERTLELPNALIRDVSIMQPASSRISKIIPALRADMQYRRRRIERRQIFR
jgi:hypothetical protein